jgi:hypothetical protein
MLVKHRRTIIYYLKANELVEKFSGVICDIIAKIVHDKRQEWD